MVFIMAGLTLKVISIFVPKKGSNLELFVEIS